MGKYPYQPAIFRCQVWVPSRVPSPVFNPVISSLDLQHYDVNILSIQACVPAQTTFLGPEEFVEDAESHLGRAKGNAYRRKPGVANVHDEQIMVRLKKKRFIFIDYGYTPNAHDYEILKTIPCISIPTRAGQNQC